MFPSTEERVGSKSKEKTESKTVMLKILKQT